MERLILLRYAELHLKGRNRGYFENVLLSHLRRVLHPFGVKVTRSNTRYLVEGFDPIDTDAIVARLTKVFGLHSLSVAECVPNEYDAIEAVAKRLAPADGTFRISTNRADKTFPLTSVQVSAQLGAALLEQNPALSVDLHEPQATVFVDIREDGRTYVYRDVVPCAGGMPVGTSGRGLLMLSGGIDSPVAGYMMARRGMKLSCVHFYSPPYTSEFARQKAEDLARRLVPYTGPLRVAFVRFTAVQEAIRAHCDSSFMVTILRRMMMRVANAICARHGLGAIVTGESLGQVASQTLESLTVTNAVAEPPVMRPLIGFDKDDIIAVARKIDTYEISIRPYDDCCTVFLPDNPQIHPKPDRVLKEEERLDVEGLLAEALATVEYKTIGEDDL